MTGWMVLAGGLLLVAGVAAFGLALCWGAGRGDDLAALAEQVGVTELTAAAALTPDERALVDAQWGYIVAHLDDVALTAQDILRGRR